MRDAGGDAAELWRRRIGPWVEGHWPDAADFLAEAVVAEANDLLLETREAFPEVLALLERKRRVPELSGGEGRARPQLIVHRLLSPGRTDGPDGFDYVGRFPGDVTRWVVHIVRREPATHLRQQLADLARRLRIVRPVIADTQEHKWLADLGG